MRKIFYLLLVIVVLLIGLVAGLHFTGYLFNNQQIISPYSSIEWNNSSSRSSNTLTQVPIIQNLTKQMKDIPGIEYINYRVFISNDSIQKNIQYYADILKKDGYSYQTDYSGISTYEYAEIYYYTFIKGLNAVVIYLSDYNHQTWICYSTGDAIHYQQIFNYMVSHHIIF